DRHIGQLRIAKNVVDAGAERKDRLEPRQGGEQPVRRLPGTGIVDIGGGARGPRPQAAGAGGGPRARTAPPPPRRADRGARGESGARPAGAGGAGGDGGRATAAPR